MNYVVAFAPEVLAQLAAIEDYIALAGTQEAAARYVDGIVECCRNLTTFPLGGTRRDDLMPGLRITNHQSRTIIAYTVSSQTRMVSIVGVFYGGQDYEASLAIATRK